jgi:hypothetical protein
MAFVSNASGLPTVKQLVDSDGAPINQVVIGVLVDDGSHVFTSLSANLKPANGETNPVEADEPIDQQRRSPYCFCRQWLRLTDCVPVKSIPRRPR